MPAVHKGCRPALWSNCKECLVDRVTPQPAARSARDRHDQAALERVDGAWRVCGHSAHGLRFRLRENDRGDQVWGSVAIHIRQLRYADELARDHGLIDPV